MIKDVPTSYDFRQSGVGFLNLAWESAMNLAIELDDIEEWMSEEMDQDVTDQYWGAAQRPLATAVALAQQGIELLIKSRIADISPYLLISGNPRDWPSGCDRQDMPFSGFRTPDAQDLLRAHDAVATNRLPPEFKTEYERLRRLRNTIFHTVDKSVRISAGEVLHTILAASDVLIGTHQWIRLRSEFLKGTPGVLATSYDVFAVAINRELAKIVENFTTADVLRFVGIDKRRRRYYCAVCDAECDHFEIKDHEIQLAQLVQGKSKLIRCFACDSEYPVKRVACKANGCKGNVISSDECYSDRCLSCLAHQHS